MAMGHQRIRARKAIDKFQPPSTTTTHASVEDIVETATDIGLKTEQLSDDLA